jgi:membrane-bound serine protease (ClpP class)
VARSALRPSGIAEIEGRRVDVVSEGGMIPPESAVQVVAVDGTKIVVRKV